MLIREQRITQVGGVLRRPPVQPPAQSRVSDEVRPGCSGLQPVRSWENSKEEDSTTSLGNMVCCLAIFMVE